MNRWWGFLRVHRASIGLSLCDSEPFFACSGRSHNVWLHTPIGAPSEETARAVIAWTPRAPRFRAPMGLQPPWCATRRSALASSPVDGDEDDGRALTSFDCALEDLLRHGLHMYVWILKQPRKAPLSRCARSARLADDARRSLRCLGRESDEPPRPTNIAQLRLPKLRLRPRPRFPHLGETSDAPR